MKIVGGVVIAVLCCTAPVLVAEDGRQQVQTGTAMSDQRLRSDVRKAHVERGKSLLSQVRETDTVVEFERVVNSSLGGLPEGVTPLEAMTKGSVVVAVVQLTGTRGRLTPSQDWIESDVSALVLQALKSDATAKDAQAASISFKADGGEIKVNNRIIRARNSSSKRLAVGQRYLIFAEKTAEGLRVANSATFLIDGDRLVPLNTSPDRAAVPSSLAKAVEQVSYWAPIK